jgi:chaperonin cofactor prefoldin
MKKISHAIVLVEEIKSSLPRTEFSETELNEAAQLLLKIEGVITPPILLETGIDSYKVIEGDFQYYAALRAEEIDPLKGETINAYIVKYEEEVPVYKKQIEVFRQGKTLPPQPVSKKEQVTELQSRDNMLHDAIKNMSDQIAKMSEQINTLQASLTKPISQPAVTPEQTTKQPTEQPLQATTSNIIASSPEEHKFLEELNTLPTIELNFKLEQIKTRKNIRENIIKERQKPSFKPFNSRHELIERIGDLAEKRFNTMLEKYNNLT